MLRTVVRWLLIMAQMKGEFLLNFSRSGWGENSPENKGMSPENQWLVQICSDVFPIP